MESDEEDFVFYGTPIEREEDISSRKKKSVAEASGQLRSVVPWKQEVRDEEGRRRFHGAFSGGFSAGYYNTVGSKEGWTPQAFTSSRKNRAEIQQQSLFNFLDDDEKAEMENNSLGTSMQFDTFGFTAAELARKQAEKEQHERPSAIPGPVPDEIIVPATDSIGVRLMLTMGWRHGHSIKDSRTNTRSDARRQARKAFLALSSEDGRAQLAGSEPVEVDVENVTDLPTHDDSHFSKSTPVYVLNPKQDMHGLGYDPFKGAPEFREKKRSRLSGKRDVGHKNPLSIKESLFGFKSGRSAPGFGIGALEELGAEDDDVYASGYDFEDTYVQEIEEPTRLMIEDKKKSGAKEHGILPGFKVASNSDYQLERFDPPVVPKDFVPHHYFSGPLEVNSKLSEVPPPEVPPPLDNNLKVLIEGVATLVARCGKLFEDLSREKNKSNPLFSFLNGGNGHDYYVRKLWEERQKYNDKTKQQLDGKMTPSARKMTAESRGKILGEKPLERSSKDSNLSVNTADTVKKNTADTVNLQFHLADTFTKPALFAEPTEVAKPFLDDPAKQERFEQYLKEKYQGGLRTKDSGGASKMSEAARARERLEFETAAEAITKGKWGKDSKPSGQHILDISAPAGLQFTSGGLEKVEVTRAEEMMMKMFPKREEFQWRPAPILCKRFDLIDPYMGKPPPPPRVRSKMDSLIFMPDSVKDTKLEETARASNKPSSVSQMDESKEVSNTDASVEVEVENVERPIDLYKAIFSDDSDDDEENANLNQAVDPTKKTEVANTTLSRLIAGDFLESLGKELGLEVPPDNPHSVNQARVPVTHKEIVNGESESQGMPQANSYHQETTHEEGSDKHDKIDSNTYRSGSKLKEGSANNSVRTNTEKAVQEDKLAKTPSDLRDWNNSSSEDERSRKRSKRYRRGRSNSDGNTTDLSEDHRDQYSSRHKGRNEGSSREKSSSRKHSKHRRHRSRDSSSRSSHHASKKDYGEAKREKRKRRD